MGDRYPRSICPCVGAKLDSDVALQRRHEAIYAPQLQSCGVDDTNSNRANTWLAFASELTCICVMLVFLFRQSTGGNIWKFLVRQGIVYFLVATVGYIFPCIFLLMDLNDSVTAIAGTQTLVTMTICATRMYRVLFDAMGDTPVTMPTSRATLSFGRSAAVARRAPVTTSLSFADVELNPGLNSMSDLSAGRKGSGIQDSDVELGPV